jgi:UDP-GlcNAc:undecaprenyl-phosphate/decaprenyl-phosphate GlcNAc-1-phosphate transferase
MVSVLFLVALGTALGLLLTPLVERASLRLGFVDRPDGTRKMHVRPVPRTGGAAVAGAYVISYAIWWTTPLHATFVLESHLTSIATLTPLVGVMFLLGLCDDLTDLSPRQKLGGQAVIAVLAFFAGVRLEGLAGHQVTGWASLLLTVAWLLACTNAFNLIDGMDGLATGLGLVAGLSILIAALTQGNIPLALAVAPLAGGLLAFLRFNRPPARIFLGDCGSLSVGFLLGCYGLLWSQKCVTLLGLTAPLMSVALPLVDTSVAIARRWLRGKPIFSADRGHIHHRLLDSGLTTRGALFVLYGAAGLAALLALLMSALQNQGGALVVIVFAVLVGLGVQRLGYVEFGAAGRLLWKGGLRRAVQDEIQLEQFRRAVASARTPEECWHAVEDAAATFGFVRRELHLSGRSYLSGEVPQGMSAWTLSIPLSEQDRLELQRVNDLQALSAAIAPFADTAAAALKRHRHPPDTGAAA